MRTFYYYKRIQTDTERVFKHCKLTWLAQVCRTGSGGCRHTRKGRAKYKGTPMADAIYSFHQHTDILVQTLCNRHELSIQRQRFLVAAHETGWRVERKKKRERKKEGKGCNVHKYSIRHTNARNILQLNCVHAFLHGNSPCYTEPRRESSTKRPTGGRRENGVECVD